MDGAIRHTRFRRQPHDVVDLAARNADVLKLIVI
jgi:hypothetical protein